MLCKRKLLKRERRWTRQTDLLTLSKITKIVGYRKLQRLRVINKDSSVMSPRHALSYLTVVRSISISDKSCSTSTSMVIS
jgi:hypothetical protein